MKASAILSAMRASLNDDLDYAKRRKASLAYEGVKAGAALLAAAVTRAESLFPGQVYHSEYFYSDSSRLNATINMSVNSLKSDTVMAFLLWLEDNVAPATDSSDYATQHTAARTFNYRHDNLRLEVCISLPVDGDACSRVQTGTKLVEQATYELRCA